jgi:2-hydroxymethylglutarate dehydrogenase
MKKDIGFIGLGAMGSGMVEMLLKNGYSVNCFDINSDSVQAAVTKGAVAAGSPAGVGKESDIIILSLPSPRIVQDTILGDQGVLKGLHPGAYIIDMSTTDPATTRNIHEVAASHGVRTLDAPVSGGPIRAAEGTLAIMVGGSEEDFEACLDVFNVLGSNVFHVGPIGAGQTVKICNNALSAVHTAVIGEVLLTGVEAGVDPKVMLDVFRESSGNCYMIEYRIPKTVLQDKYEPPSFSMELMIKDVGLYLKTAQEMNIPSIITGTVYQIYTAGQSSGKGKKDHTAVVQVIEEMAGKKISGRS